MKPMDRTLGLQNRSDIINSLYYIWGLKTKFLFFILTCFTENNLYGINFPIEIIRLILCIYLKIEQKFIYPGSRWHFECYDKKCIIKWWSFRYRNNFNYFHCYNKECHNIVPDCFKCSECDIALCNDCVRIGENCDYFVSRDEDEDGFKDAYSLIAICVSCEKSRDDIQQNAFTCHICKIRGYDKIICSVCDIKICRYCSYQDCKKSCQCYFCNKCSYLFINGTCPICINKEYLYKLFVMYQINDSILSCFLKKLLLLIIFEHLLIIKKKLQKDKRIIFSYRKKIKSDYSKNEFVENKYIRITKFIGRRYIYKKT